MAFFNSAVGVLQTLVVALGAGLGVWGAINLLEGYGNDNPGAKSQGIPWAFRAALIACPIGLKSKSKSLFLLSISYHLLSENPTLIFYRDVVSGGTV